MNHKIIHNDLIFYIDNELSFEKRITVEKHLEVCADCRSFLSFLKEEMLIIDKERNPEASPFFFTRLSARIDERPEHQRQIQWAGLAQSAVFSLLLVLGIYGGLRIGNITSLTKLNQPATGNIQMLNDFEAEPIESFLLDKL